MTTTTTSTRRTATASVAAAGAGTAGRTSTTQRGYARRGQRVALGHEPGALPRKRATTVVSGRIPFVTVIMGLLGCGLALTLLLTTRSAEESYQLADARTVNQQLMNERARLQREVESADSAPNLAMAAGKLGMVPTRDPAHLVVGRDGTVVVIGKPKPASGAPAPALNQVLPAVNPDGTVTGRVFPDSTVLSSGAGVDPRAGGEQLVQVPVGSLVAPPGAPAAALPAPLAAPAPAPGAPAAPGAPVVRAPGAPAPGPAAPAVPAAAAAVPAAPAVPAEGGPAAPAPAVTGHLPAPVPAPPTGGAR